MNGQHLLLVRRVGGLHPGLWVLGHVVTAVIAVIILLNVASARGRSKWWALLGIGGLPGLVVGLLVLIALPVQPQTR